MSNAYLVAQQLFLSLDYNLYIQIEYASIV